MDLATLRRLHSFTGLVPLSAYMGFHAWEHWPVRVSRDAALERMQLVSSAPVEIVVLMLPLLVHAGLGLRLLREPDETRAYASPAFRWLQASTGLVTLVFLLWHVGGVWLPRVIASGSALAAYSAMLDQAGPSLGMGLYVLGVSAVCIHFGQGLGAAWIRYTPTISPLLARAVGAVVGAAIWLVMLDLLAVYATGAALM